MSITLPDLPYAPDALEPHMSEETMRYHYGKHHQGYVDKTNALIKGTALENRSLEDIIREAKKDGNEALFNNAAQVWNHTFFWNSMKPDGGGAAGGKIGRAIEETFGNFENFKDSFTTAATDLFGSGWAWLVVKENGIEILTTPNADTPRIRDLDPILTCDVWEHAYYLDFQNDRETFARIFLDKLANWEFAEKRLSEFRDKAGRDAA